MSTTSPAESSQPENAGINIEEVVRERYSTASQSVEAALCCPVEYEPRHLEVLPQELLERDYGCGDPSRWVREGETVLDLGSGGGKICYIASQIVGPRGRVIGVDMNDDMLALARRHRDDISGRIGWNNVEFRKGRIQDLALDLEAFSDWLRDNPVQAADDWLAAEQHAASMRRTSPMIPSDAIDVVLSNCVLNLVDPAHRRQLFDEVFRVLRRGGRAVISDIVCDEPVPDHLRNDPQLWSGCISGAFVQSEFFRAFEQAGFYGMEIMDRGAKPWAVIEGIEFRSVTVQAYKGKDGPCWEHNEAVIYRGPFKSVADDDGHTYRRGEPMAVCRKTFEILGRPPYDEAFIPVPPAREISAEKAQPFDCRRSQVREPRETKNGAQPLTVLPENDCCGPNDCC
ncbi:MAG: methyltransferase domain-containing protein [Pirellulaceae bacterium]